MKQYDEQCALILDKLVFNKISFERKDWKTEGEPKFSLKINTSTVNDESIYRVTVILFVNKENEYDIEINLSGYFLVNKNIDCNNINIMDLINQNAVAILIPYIRSELSLITAQPEMECLVMPPINVGALLKNHNDE